MVTQAPPKLNRSPARQSIVIRLLRFLREFYTANLRGASRLQIGAWLLHEQRVHIDRDGVRFEAIEVDYFPRNPRKRHALNILLADLIELGVVSRTPEGQYLLASDMTGREEELPLSVEDSDGGAGGEAPPPGAGGPPGDATGRGLQEVIAHPVLFSYSKEDFIGVVRDALGVNDGD